MMLANVNFLMVVVVAVITMVVGFIYYSPAVVGNQWMKLMGWKKKDMAKMKKDMGPKYLLALIATVIEAFVLAQLITVFGVTTVTMGATIGFWMWLGFVTPIQLGMVIWSSKSHQLYVIDTIYQLIVLLVMGGLLAIWL